MGLVPMVLTREGNHERAMDITSCLLQQRIIMLAGDVNTHDMSIIKQQLLWLESQDPNSDIYMYIDSPGGEVLTGLGVYDTMQYIKPDVCTINLGMCASMGSFLLMGGAPGKRFSLPNVEVMIHQPSGGTQGKASDMKLAVDHIIRLRQKLYDIYAKHTKMSQKQMERLFDRDTWLTAEQALELGLIDKIITHRGEEQEVTA